jgi:4-amino-4-deoxy-L-arabinose transferase-like glycosyltransferase
MANSNGSAHRAGGADRQHIYFYIAVLLLAGAVYLGCIISPPSLMDDVDAVQAQIARTMLTSGDWVTARLDGVSYLEKSPLIYWWIAGTYKILGVHDWVARIPVALSAIALCWLTAAFGMWAFGKRAGFYAGLVMATCVGLFLFTRVLIPDVMLTFTVALAMWAFLRVLDYQERHPRFWAFALAASMGTGLLLKSTVALLFPIGGGVIYLSLTRQLFLVKTWKRLHPFSGTLIILLIAAPWHVLATLRNPPYFDFTLQSIRGQYHGFLWFYFMNEQVLRFLNLRYPRDYNTVPRVLFWLLHLLWLFPWSVYFPAVAKLEFKPVDRAGRTRLLALCWTGFMLVFFTFSTTQEYYTMPCYPALALLLGSAMAMGGDWVRRGTRTMGVVAACAAVALLAILFLVRNVPVPGDIAESLVQRPGTYTLALSHMGDLTLASFAYLRLPMAVAAVAFLAGTIGMLRFNGQRAFLAGACMMVLFFHAARLAMVTFDPFLSSRPLAEALLRSPDGKLIVDHHYYTFSSVFFYTNRSALLLNGRINNLVYGSYAPDAPDVFIDDAQWKHLWTGTGRYYIVAEDTALPRLEALVGKTGLHAVIESGGKGVWTNQPLL